MKQASLTQLISEPSWKCGVEADEKEANRSQHHAGHARVVDPWCVEVAGVASKLRTGVCLS